MPKPVITVYQLEDGKMLTTLSSDAIGVAGYGLLIADIVRHVANAFHVHENDVWEWVDKERDHPTTPITELKPS